MTVIKADVVKACKELGIKEGDLVLVHSSMKSLGFVEGGPETVIAGFREAIGEEGTLVMPTIANKNFDHVYEEWHIDRPSDVGLITETLRKMEGAYRSDQATHSVAAIGKRAQEITCEHTAFGPRYGIYGPYAFGKSSPWQKMYDIGGKVVFLGVIVRKNTFKHFVEYKMVDDLLAGVKDEKKRDELRLKVWYHYIENGKDVIRGSIWPLFDMTDMEHVLDARGMIAKTTCGAAELKCIDIKETVNFMYDLLMAEYPAWLHTREGVVEWIDECIKCSKEGEN